MKPPGTFAPIIKPDKIVDNDPHDFHIKSKDKLREMIELDPECNGSSLTMFLQLVFNKKFTRTTEPDEVPAPNEEFIIKMVDDYNRKVKEYKPGIIEKRIITTVEDFFVALYRVDSAYTERIGGTISYMITQHISKCKSIDGDYIEILKDTHEWWKESDFRERTFGWIDWGFRFIIKKYQTKKFYKKSINHMLMFINLNQKNWKYYIIYDPENWYPFGRGMECNLVNGCEY